VSSYLDSFDQIILSTDNDDVGRQVAEVLFDLFPSKVYIMDHGKYKDANDFLQAKDGKAYKSSWWSAKRYSPAGFTAGAEDWLKAVHEETPYEYTPTFSDSLNDVIRGWVKGGVTVVKALPGTGKTSVFRASQHDLVVKKGQRVGVLHMEEMKSTTARGMATYHLGKNVNTKEDQEFYDVSNEELDIAISEVVEDNKFVAFEVNPQDPIEDTLKQAKYAVTVYGCDYLFIDHLQRLAYLSGVDGATAALTELGVRLVEFSKRRNVGIICISHVNEDGKTKYARSIEEEAIQLIELKRDMKAEGDDANLTSIEITKNRPYSRLGEAGQLHYNPETTMVKGV
jgi:replicative DNA helicase